ncbi:MAG: hypothetical protein HPY50_04685 [Firmicutes bacterium]|nr:hypothetical protein [Bacillota bacterium]
MPSEVGSGSPFDGVVDLPPLGQGVGDTAFRRLDLPHPGTGRVAIPPFRGEGPPAVGAGIGLGRVRCSRYLPAVKLRGLVTDVSQHVGVPRRLPGHDVIGKKNTFDGYFKKVS